MRLSTVSNPDAEVWATVIEWMAPLDTQRYVRHLQYTLVALMLLLLGFSAVVLVGAAVAQIDSVMITLAFSVVVGAPLGFMVATSVGRLLRQANRRFW